MIFSKFYCLTKSHSSCIILIRTYVKPIKFRPLIMPKDNTNYLNELQRQRKRIKAQATKFAPSHVFLQVIGNGSVAEPRAVLLVTDHTNYLFNCGEGTQRLASEHHAKLTKIEHIFVTRPVWKNMGGIPGVQLTIQDTGVPRVTIHGPDGTVDLVEATKSFVTLNQLEVSPADISAPFNDQTMKVTYVPLENSSELLSSRGYESGKTNHSSDNINFHGYEGDKEESIINSNNKRQRSLSGQSENDQNSKSQKRINTLMAYICKIHPKKGALNITKCAELGVPPGPLLGKLKSGSDVTLPDGRVIKSQDVVGRDEPGPLFIVVECPDENWIDVIVQNPVFAEHQKIAQGTDQLAKYVIHFTSENIIKNPKYQAWMQEFGEQTQHLVLNEKNGGYTSEAMHKMQIQLNQIHKTIFPLLEGQKLACTNDNMYSELKEKGIRLHYFKTLSVIHLRPHKGLDPVTLTLKPSEYIEEIHNIDNFTDTLQELKKEIKTFNERSGKLEEYPKLLMLGTGSSIPNKVRNTSGMLLQIDEERSIILDCGEGTFGQMYRFFGPSKIENILRTIKAIYVSHLHADHHLGLIGILKEREKVTDEPIFLLAPQQIVPYLCFYHNRFESVLNLFRIVSNRDILANQVILTSTTSKDLLESLDVFSINTCFVKHCPFAFGVAITLKDGRKISYSGDCVPSDNFQKLAKNSYLMIHEATMEDLLEKEALMKYHSTISQAVSMGIKTESKFTLLTHFSQRYSKIPMLPVLEDGDTSFNKVGIAYDFMQISLSQLSLLPLFYPTFNLMFSEFKAILDERTTKREFRRERIVNSLN